MNSPYDVIICGAGLSGRLLAYYIVKNDLCSKILLLDRAFKQKDALLSFWEVGEGDFDFLLEGQTKLLETRDSQGVLSHYLNRYSYKWLYKNKLFTFIDEYLKGKVDFIEANIKSITPKGDHVVVKSETSEYFGNKVFSSIRKQNKKKSLLNNYQHIRSFEIETNSKSKYAILMDFSINQDCSFCFGNTIPLNDNHVFVTIINYKKLPTKEDLKLYMKNNLKICNYRVIREEAGISCLTISHVKSNSPYIIYIGERGGMLNSSSGLGFPYFIKSIKYLLGLERDNNTSWIFNILFGCMILFINICPKLARYLFIRINRVSKFDYLLDFVDAKGGLISVFEIFKAIIFS